MNSPVLFLQIRARCAVTLMDGTNASQAQFFVIPEIKSAKCVSRVAWQKKIIYRCCFCCEISKIQRG